MTHSVPTPRPAVADPGLRRPDWTRGDLRDPARLWLDKNENSDPDLARVVREVVIGMETSFQYTYPETPPVYRKLAGFLGLKPENLLFAAGSDGLIRAVFEAFVAPGDTVLHTAPTFAMYFVYSKMYGAREVSIAYEPSEAGPVLPAERLIEAIGRERPRAVFLPNPDSPTGTWYPLDAMRAIVEAAGEAGAVMLVDEAYWPFHPDTCLPWVNDYPHLLVTRSTGKAWGLAGFRVGYGAAAPELAAVLHKVKAMYEVNTFGLAVFERMIDRWPEIEASVHRLEVGKADFLAAMHGLGLKTLQGRGNFLHVVFGTHAEKVHAALADLVYYRADFAEPCLKGYSRFSATTPKLFRPVIERIRKVVKGENPS
jgi:histidinol-phosphate aminotransferase